jgi:hypothetical protein
MITLKILAHPRLSLFSELFPFYRWKNQLKDHGIKVEIFHNEQDKDLRGADKLLIQSKQYTYGWQNITTRTPENQSKLIEFLTDIKKDSGKLIWFDQSDSTGSLDFPIIKYVDTFVVKQLLKDINYYTEPSGNKNLRVWLNPELKAEDQNFVPCPKDQLHKIRVGWNTGYNDYRKFRYKFKNLSHHIGYSIYPLTVTKASKDRKLDLSYRGRLNYDSANLIAIQRNKVFKMLENLKAGYQILKGAKVSRSVYLRELSNSKVSISPFGFGEVCYRDFESFISGALLIKPSMEHLVTFPNVYIPNETYIPVLWDISDLQEKFENVIDNFDSYKQIAQNGQDTYLNTVNDPECFVNAVKRIIE